MDPGNGRAPQGRGAGEAAHRHVHGATRSQAFLSAGGASRYFVARVDGNRRVTARLSGFAATLDEGLAFLRWARRRHADAQLVREVLFREVLA